MELEHAFTVPVPRDRAWDVLLDVERVAPCMPGASLDSVDGDAISGKIKVKVGPISMTYAGTARFTERDADAGVVTLEASGKETRGSGTASASVRSVLEDQGEQTRVTVHTNLNVTGKPAQFGRGVMSEVSGKLIGIFADNLAAMLSAAPAPESVASSPVSGSSAALDASVSGPSTAAGSSTAAPAGDPDAAAQAASADGPDSALSLPIEELQLPIRSYNSLRRDGVHTVGDLAARTPQDLLAIENIGPASVEEIRQKLAGRGLSLSDSAAGATGVQPVAGAAAAVTPPAPVPPAPAASPAAAAPPAAAPPAAAPSAAAPAAAAAPVASAPAASVSRPVSDLPPSWQPDNDAINLVGVAGVPVLKRVIPVVGALAVAVLVALGVRRRRKRS